MSWNQKQLNWSLYYNKITLDYRKTDFGEIISTHWYWQYAVSRTSKMVWQGGLFLQWGILRRGGDGAIKPGSSSLWGFTEVIQTGHHKVSECEHVPHTLPSSMLPVEKKTYNPHTPHHQGCHGKEIYHRLINSQQPCVTDYTRRFTRKNISRWRSASLHYLLWSLNVIFLHHLDCL